jgi:hypothetical protein
VIENKYSLLSVALIASLLLLGGCQSVRDDLKNEIPDGGKPRREISATSNRDVQVPDLDERKADTQYLSKIDRLEHQVFELNRKLKAADEERTAAVKIRKEAQSSESTLATMIEEYEATLASSADREKKLKERLLRAQLDSVHYQQMVADMKIRDLTKGDGQ